MRGAVKEFNIFTSEDLTNFDRTVKVAYQGHGVKSFDNWNDRWRYNRHYTKHLRTANNVANAAINKMFSGV